MKTNIRCWILGKAKELIPSAYGMNNTPRLRLSFCAPFCTARNNKKTVTQSWYSSSSLTFHKTFFGLNQTMWNIL
jgi:hypothetical protein